MASKLMIYGAYGYTGDLISRQAVAQGLSPVLAGRDASKLKLLAEEIGAEWQAIDLEDAAAMRAGLADVSVVINCAGPFVDTWEAMVQACLASGTTYLDISGEISVLSEIAAMDKAAKAAGVALMPACGFDVVPTDCMAAMLLRKLPTVTRMRLAFCGIEKASRGTLLTSARSMSDPIYIRKNGELIPLSGPKHTMIDFGEGPEKAYATTWGDLVTIWHMAKISSIEVFVKPSKDVEFLFQIPEFLRQILGSPIGRPILQAKIYSSPPGPDLRERKTGSARIFGEASDDDGNRVVLRMRTAEPYELTSKTATEIVRRALEGRLPPGFQTPAGVFGADFILEFEGSKTIS